MTERFEQYDGGKGPDDRSDANKRANSPLWKQVRPKGGVMLTSEDAAHAMEQAFTIIKQIEWDSEASKWMQEYFPNQQSNV